MEELKELVGIVSQLPGYALVALLGFLAYKLVVVGSVYSLCRFVVEKLYAVATAPRVTKYTLPGHWMSEREAASLSMLLRRAGASDGEVSPGTMDRLYKALTLLEELRR